MKKILDIEEKLYGENKEFLGSVIKTKDELKKVFRELGENNILKNHLLSKGIVTRIYYFNLAQKWFNEKFGRCKKIDAANFFEDTVALYLRAYLEVFSNIDFEMWVQKRYEKNGRKYVQPDISVEINKQVKFILQAKTQLGWGRPIDKAGNVRKEENALLTHANEIKTHSRLFRLSRNNFYLVIATCSNWMGKNIKMEDVLNKHRKAGYVVPKRKQFIILSKKFPSPNEGGFPMTKNKQLTDGDFQDFIEPLFQKIKLTLDKGK